jgi:hypothetical protein
MDHYIVGKTADQILDVLWSKLSSKHLTVPDQQSFFYIAINFQKRWNFPNVVGCIDGKYIRFKCPSKLDHCFKLQTFFFSVVL